MSNAATLVVMATLSEHAYAAWEALLQVRAHCSERTDVFLVVDGPDTPAVVDLVAALSAWSDGFRFPTSTAVYRNPHRVGLVRAYNLGFRRFLEGEWQYLHLLEDHVRVVPGWDAAMRRVLRAHPMVGWTACGQQENSSAPFTSLCSMMTRDCAELVRGLDDVFHPCQYDDGDLFMRVTAHGYTPVAVPVQVSHPCSRTSREGTVTEDVALMERHGAVFRERWGVADPPWGRVPVHQCPLCQPQEDPA